MMTQRMFCDNCDRDLTDDDYVEVRIQPSVVKIPMRVVFDRRDYCIWCAREVLGIRVEEKSPEP
jgi:RNase P subunit RPR2